MRNQSEPRHIEPSFGMQAKLFKDRPQLIACYFRGTTFGTSSQHCNLTQVWCSAYTSALVLWVNFQPVFYDLEQRQGRKFAVSPEEREVVTMKLKTVGPHQLGMNVQFFKSHQVCLVRHL
jgi:hypothetical protein